jgi:hypothetical protein
MIALARRRGPVVSAPTATEDIGAMGCEIESRQGIHRVVAFSNKSSLTILKILYFLKYY